MARLRSCYFCGTTGALSEYETVPDDAGDASRRVVLCDRCHTKLANVLTPILDRPNPTPAARADEVGSTDEEGSTNEGGSANVEAVANVNVERAAGSRSDQTDVTFSPDARESEDETPREPPSTDSGERERETRIAGGARDGEPGAETDDGHDEPSRVDGDAPVDHDGSAPRDASSTSAGVDSPADADVETPPGGDAEPGPETADSARSGTEPDEASPADDAERTRDELGPVYHKLLRFLRNREFPIPRAEAEAVAQSAYDLDERDARDVIQRAIDREVLVERDGDLHRR